MENSDPRFFCPLCGGDVARMPTVDLYRCDHCGHCETRLHFELYKGSRPPVLVAPDGSIVPLASMPRPLARMYAD